MKKFFISLLGLTLIISFGMMAEAREGKGGRHKDCKNYGRMGHRKMMDTNKDGKVSLKEWQDFHDKRFKELDENKDGFISDDEMKPPKGMGPKPVEK